MKLSEWQQNHLANGPNTQLIDKFQRNISYVRLSVTDRCDFRCVYCMPKDMVFLPKKDLLTLEELETICVALSEIGIKKIRLTGGEPLVRKNVISLFQALGKMVRNHQLDEVTLTTNGSKLVDMAIPLKDAGVKRVNVSLDSLDADFYRKLTRNGDLQQVIKGIMAAKRAGLQVKINTVAIKSGNEKEFDTITSWCNDHGFDLTFIEVMPMGDMGDKGDMASSIRFDQFISLGSVKDILSKNRTLEDISYNSGGPARYMRVKETGQRLGFITPLSHNFCASCNRIRIDCTGRLHLCLGHDDAIDLRNILREHGALALKDRLIASMQLKPEKHDFIINEKSVNNTQRHMSVTGG